MLAQCSAGLSWQVCSSVKTQTVFQETKGDAAVKRAVEKATCLLVETSVLWDTVQHSHTGALLIHSVIKYSSLTSENIGV